MGIRNLTLLSDFYELTMGNGYFLSGKGDKIAYFDIFFRDLPDNGGYAVAAGLELIIDYIENLCFTDEDIEYLRQQKLFDEQFLVYLKNFKFTGDIWAVPEGTPIFPREPALTVRAPVIQAQFIETYLLTVFNHQSLIATKSNRICRAAEGRPVSEFGARRAQGADASVYGARASYIGGCSSTSCTLSGKQYGIPVSGTMAHSWVQLFDTEYEAFRTYCELYPNNTVLLIDTYNALESGMKNAIKAIKDVLVPMGKTNFGVRLDSGDIAYLTKRMREMLDEAGLPTCKIIVSNALDEKIITDILRQGACCDGFGVGERLVTAKSDPVFGGVYKLAAVEDESGNIIPKIKISENPEKITNPHFKKLYRLFYRDGGRAIADYITIHDEIVNDKEPLTIFDPDYTWKNCTLTSYEAVPLLERIYDKGKLVYNKPSLKEIRDRCEKQVGLLWDEVKRFEYPHRYYVDLSQKLWDLKQNMLKNNGKANN